jgi:uncharacterized protein (TIGR03437 family)
LKEYYQATILAKGLCAFFLAKICRIPRFTFQFAIVTRLRIFTFILAGVVVLCLLGVRSTQTQSPLRRITNTTEEGININPSISGDGRIVAFESTEDIAAAGGSDHFRAIRANIAVDPPRFFQMGGTRAVAAAISQDGSRIAFASTDDPLGTNLDGNSEIFLLDGSRLIQLTNTTPGDIANRVTNGNFQPSISDNGRFIAFASNRDLAGQNADGSLEIFVYDAAATTFAQLTNSNGIVGCGDAKISGNGAKVAFVRDLGTTPSARRDLMIQDRTSGPATVIASQVRTLLLTYGRAISDDGTRIVYSGETATNSSQVFMFDGRGGAVNRQITSLGTRVTEVPLHATISGDGTRIAFATRRNFNGFNSDGSVELYVYDSPTATFLRITNAPSSATADVVSSLNDDGSIVAFNFPRILSGTVNNSDSANDSEIYVSAPMARSPFGALTAILNGASFGNEPSAIKAVAPESIAVAHGSNLANTTLQSQRLPNKTFPTNVAGTTVTVNGRPAQIFFVSPGQVNFLVPPATEIGTADVVVTNSENFQSRGNVPTLRTAPGVFTRPGEGTGEGMILNSDTLQPGPFDPTGGNLRLTLFATGARNAVQTLVAIGGRVVPAESVMASPDMPGLDEVRVLVPSDLRGTGTATLSVQCDGRDGNPVTVTFTGDPGRDIFFNEVLADPPTGPAGDANHDGVRDGTQDEFVELVNGTAHDAIGLSGWTIKTRATGGTTETTRFTFPGGTTLPAGEAVVVFGGGTFNPSDPVFGCAQVLKVTSSSGLALTNGGLTIVVRDGAGNLIREFSYGGSIGLDGGNGQSLTRSPDITGNFGQHSTVAGARKFSPGLKVDGTPFGSCPGHPATVTIAPPTKTINVGQTTQFTGQAFDQYGRAMTGVTITFASDNTTVATVDSVSTNSGTGIATATIGAHNPGTAHITATATNGTTTANSSQSTVIVSGPSLTINDVSLNEGNSGPTTFTFVVSLSQPAPTGGVTFNIATQDNTATVADDDYVARSLTAQTIPAGQQTYNFAVTVNGDSNIEPNETFFVNVTNVTGASVGNGQGLGTIVNDDSPVLSINDSSANEGNSGPTTFTFTVASTVPAPAGGVTFDIATQDGTATSASGDYVACSLTTQTIPAGQTTYTFNVTVNGDTLVEPNEAFFVKIANPSGGGATIGGSDQGTGTIKNDDAADLVISQTYPGGGLTGATLTNDFVELFNQGSATVDFAVTPFSVQFLSTSASAWAKTDLTAGTLAPGRYFLVKETSGGVNGAALPTADATGTLNLTSTSAGKVALVVGANLLVGACPGDNDSPPFNPLDGTVVDFVGYGGTAATGSHCYEGAGPAPYTLSNNTTADFRKFGGCQDTDDNTSDFVAATPNPRNASSALNDCTAADLGITKTDSPDPVITGSHVNYTITVTNFGPATARFVVVTDSLPASVTFVSCASTGAGLCGGSGNNRTVNFASLAAGASETITLVATAHSAGGTTITNTATVSSSTTDPTPVNNSAIATTAVNNPNFADLSISKSDSIDPVAPGGNLTYTISLTNNGPDTAQSPRVTDTLPAEVTFVDCSSNQGGVCGGSATSPTVSFASLANGATATITIHAIVSNSLTTGAVINNTASVTASSVDSNPANNSDSESTTIHEVNPGDVLISEFRFRGSAGANDEFIELYNPTTRTIDISGFKIFRSNNAAATTQQATINSSVFLPAGCHYLLTNANASGPYDDGVPGDQTYSTGITDDGGIAVTPASGTASTGILDQVGLSSGSAYKEGTALASLGTTNVDHTYERKPGGAFGNGTDTSDNSADFLLNASSSNPQNSSIGCLDTSSADLSLTKTDSPDPVTIGSNITYTITVLNNGAAVAQSVLVTDNLPAEVTFVSCNSTGPGVCGGSGNNRTVTVASFTSGASITITLVATANGPHGATATNTATVSSATPDSNSSNNSATATTLMQEPTPNLSISDVTMNEGNSGPATFGFIVTLFPASSQTVTVNYATANGTAMAGSDYTAIPSTQLTFLPTETTKTVNVTASGDTTVEPDETFTVNLSGNSPNSAISDAQGVGTITNDDGALVVISQIYGGGGNSSATYNADFVELLNRTSMAINITAWSIQSQSAATTGGTWTVAALCPSGTCSIPANSYYLVRLTNPGATGAALPTPDSIPTTTINLSATAAKVALANSTTALTNSAGVGCPTSFANLVDLVGYGSTANCFEGAGPAPGPASSPTSVTNTTSVLRKSSGCQDTNVNSSDFVTISPPMPRNSSSTNICP